jgi:hypothetical protein
MAINDQYKIDLAYKKLGYGVQSTSTTKNGFEEARISPIPTYDSDIWAEASSIPAIAAEVPNLISKVTLEVLTDDVTVANHIVFLSSYKDFIPTSFGSTYVIEVYDSNNNRLSQSSTNFFFDYTSGTLIFPEGAGSYNGYSLPFKITGYRYIGIKGLDPVASLPDKTGNAGKFLAVTSDETAFEYKNVGGNKDIVFMVGDDLLPGVQEHTEIRVPYIGTIVKLAVTIGLNSTPDSNLIFAIQKYDGGEWVNIIMTDIGIIERFKESVQSVPISTDRLRINLITGDYANVANMSIILTMSIN